jgi:putative alpha-1,2-mannosidase
MILRRRLLFTLVLSVIGFVAPGSITGAAGSKSGDADADSPINHVNTFIGTDEAEHTFPGAAYPFGMVQLSPDTGGTHGLYLMADWKWCAGYHYSDSTILGFSHLHRSGMGVGDWGDVLVMPTVGKLRIKPGEDYALDKGYRSRFSHERETAEPGYYAVSLDDYDVRAELTAGPRSGFHRYTFPASESSHILIDLGHGLGDTPIGSEVKIAGNNRILGTRTSTGRIHIL